ncbi:hypothetical protein BCV70DRAFT_231846 [Testicularia cyperi]|uniref:Fanconi-associated nuclease n=1 Tax=Testicularia cyperi TaxID=1882483 RepID=A0A317XQ57_9BASI|nr:hypothetical protein BCV70DRAFT_231846 [Testicularia cyperi]
MLGIGSRTGRPQYGTEQCSTVQYSPLQSTTSQSSSCARHQANRERVQRDEAIAARTQAEEKAASVRADSEARIELLRRRANQDSSQNIRSSATSDSVELNKSRSRHRERVYEEDSPGQGSTRAKSRAHEDRTQIGSRVPRVTKRPRQEYSLARPADELEPWYADPDLKNGSERRKTADQQLEEAFRDSSSKSSNDPLKAMESFLAQHTIGTSQAPLGITPKTEETTGDCTGNMEDMGHHSTSTSVETKVEKKQEVDAKRENDEAPSNSIFYRPGSRTSMYPELFQQMVCTVLESESYLFSNAELDILSSFFMLSYPARYLFVRLLQRKRNTWYRLDRLSNYQGEVGDLQAAKEELANSIGEPSTRCPKVEPARVEEQQRRTDALLNADDKENLTLTLPSLQKELRLDETTGLPIRTTYHHQQKRPLVDSTARQQPKLPNSTTDRMGEPQSAPTEAALDRFVLTERDMRGGTEESLSLLTIEELKLIAKNLGITKLGTTRAQILSTLTATKSQSTLFGSPTKTSGKSQSQDGSPKGARQLTLNFGSSGKKKAQTSRLNDELSAVLGGGCIQVLPAVRSLVDRVALVYYRGNLLGSAALTTAILSRSRIRNYPSYSYKRTAFLFPSRDHLIAFERALDIEAQMEQLIQFGKSEADFRAALALFDSVWDEWCACVQECTSAHPEGIDKLVYHRMRYHPGWVLTRIVYKGATVLARFKMHDREKQVLGALLDQKVFRRGRRGDWYDRLALITALHSPDARKGKREALQISIRGIQDPDTHLIYHDTLQRRIGRLESQLRIPRSEQHDFSYAKLKKTTEEFFKGTRLDSMLETDEKTNEPVTAMSRFLQQQNPSPPPAPQNRTSTKRGSPSRTKSESPSPTKLSPTAEKSGFQIRKPLFKRVKVETYSEPSHGKAPASDVQHEGVADVPGLGAVKKEDEELDDISWDEITAPAPDATSLALVSGGDGPSTVSSSTRRSMRSLWRGLDNAPCHVEQLCLQHYALQGFKGYHCEGKLLTMIFVMVMWDVLFLDSVPGSFETQYQSAPLDLGSDAFPIVRSAEMRARYDHIERTGGLDLIAAVDERERPRKTWAVGCRWDMFGRDDLLEVAECMGGRAISIVCQMLAEEWDHCSSGMPDLVIWRMSDKTVRFVEIKGPGDRLSETQKVWIDILLRAGVEVQVGLVVEA